MTYKIAKKLRNMLRYWRSVIIVGGMGIRIKVKIKFFYVRTPVTLSSTSVNYLLLRVSRSRRQRDYLQCIFIGRSVARFAVLPRPFICPNPDSNLNAETSIEFVFHAYHPWKRSVIHIYKYSQLISLNLRPINSRHSDTNSDIGVSCVP